MSRNLHSALATEIDEVVKRHHSTGQSLSVYAEAYRMARMGSFGMIALEDVVIAFIQHPMATGIAFELDPAAPSHPG